MIKIAVPNKGSLSEAATGILKEAGYKGRGVSKALNIVDEAKGGHRRRRIATGSPR